jgi:hypothetical protein
MELDATGFQQGLAKAGASLNAFATGQLGSIKGMLAGAFTVGAIGRLATDAISLGGKFDDLSKRTGISAEELQRLDYAAQQNGSSIEAMVGGLQKLAVARQKALADPGGEAAAAFRDLGVDPNLSSEQAFYRIADAVKNMGAAQNNAASMTALLGRSFGELVPMMMDGGDALQKFADMLVVISNADIKKLDAIGDDFKTLSMNITASVGSVAARWMDVGTLIGVATQNVKGFIDTMRGLQTPEAKAFADALLGDMTGAGNGPTKPGLSGAPPATASDSDVQKFRDAQQKAREQAMTDEEKIADLQQRSAAKYEEAAAAYKKEKAEGVKLETEALKLATQAEALQKKVDDQKEAIAKQDAIAMRDIKEGKGISVSAPISDNLARIGGYVGGAGSSALRVAERQEKIQEKMRDYLKKIAERDMTSEQIRDATPR